MLSSVAVSPSPTRSRTARSKPKRSSWFLTGCWTGWRHRCARCGSKNPPPASIASALRPFCRGPRVVWQDLTRPSMRGQAGDRHDQMKIPAELVDLPHVAGHEGRPLRLAQVDPREGGGGIRGEARAKLWVLLEAVEQAVDRVAAHASLHSTAAMLMRGSAPK